MADHPVTTHALIESGNETGIRLSPLAKKKIYASLATASLLALVVGQKHLGVLIVLALMPLTVWLTYSAYVFVTRPYLRIAQIVSVGIWVIAIGLVLLVHYIRHVGARADADVAVQAIRDHTRIDGKCPMKLEGLAITQSGLPEKLKADFAYSCEKGKPSFSYEVTYTVFDRYVYDFEQRVWTYQDWSKKKAWLDTW
jgi:hypothetical protein